MTEILSPHVNDFGDYRLTGDPRISPEETARQISCYRRLFSPLDHNNTVADIACGDGRQTLSLAELYEKVVGVDIDERQLRRAQQLSAGINNTFFVRGDMRKVLPFNDGAVDGVLSGFSSWGFYGKDGDLKSLRQMSRILKKDGVFVLDYGNVEARIREIEEKGTWTENLQQRVVVERLRSPNGSEVLRTSWVDSDMWYHWICQSVESANPLVIGSQKGYRPDELSAMLQEVGLRPTAAYGGYGSEPVNDTNTRLIIRAEKQ